ncbi:MAG: hypothetical protein JW753_06980 [Dehalococcoidia bacterium]|nr:hypothetical protein [Dehalococcoidia bacterium]
MSMGSGDWVEEVVRKAVQKEMGETPQTITMTTTRLTSRRAFPVSASLRMPDGREVEVSMTVEADMYSDFKITRGARKSGAGA